jgi:hypothetical protein
MSSSLVSSTLDSAPNNPLRSFPPSATYLAAICSSSGKLLKNFLGVSRLTVFACSSKLA